MDTFKRPNEPGRYYVNEVEGFEAATEPIVSNSKAQELLNEDLANYWHDMIMKLINSELKNRKE